ncbi:MAG: hypothetical protein AAFX03_02870 [Pseudomonadota bacterium]
MKTAIWAIAALALLGACGAPSETTPETPVAEPPFEPDIIEEDDDLVAGGWAPSNAEDEIHAAARELAIQTVYDRRPTRALVDTVTAEIQVVAGLNHRFRIEMTGAETARNIYSVTVYENLENELEVTGFEQLQ